jgi:hypothetical protein
VKLCCILQKPLVSRFRNTAGALNQSRSSPTIHYAKFAAMGHADRVVVAQQDRMVDPELARVMAGRAMSETIELHGSHAIFLSRLKDVAALIKRAAKAAE